MIGLEVILLDSPLLATVLLLVVILLPSLVKSIMALLVLMHNGIARSNAEAE